MIARDWRISRILQHSHSPSLVSVRYRAAEAALFLLWSSFKGGTPRSTPGLAQPGLRFWVSETKQGGPEEKVFIIPFNMILVSFRILTF